MSFGKKVNDMRRRMELLNRAEDSFEDAKELMADGDLLGAREQMRAAKQMYRMAKNPSKIEEVQELEDELEDLEGEEDLEKGYQDNPFRARYGSRCNICSKEISEGASVEWYSNIGDEDYRQRWVVHEGCIDAAIKRPIELDPPCPDHGHSKMVVRSGRYGAFWACRECDFKKTWKDKLTKKKTKKKAAKKTSVASFNKDALLERARDVFRRRQAQSVLSADDLEDFSDLGRRLKAEGKLTRRAMQSFMDYLERAEAAPILASIHEPPALPSRPSRWTPPRGGREGRYGCFTANRGGTCCLCGNRWEKGEEICFWKNNAQGMKSHKRCADTSMPAKADAVCQVCKDPINIGDYIYPWRDLRPPIWVHEGCELDEITSIEIPEKFQPHNFTPSSHQENIRDVYLNTNQHMIIEAKAGSGKSTTLEWLICTTFTPPVKKMLLTAFNVSIARELQGRLVDDSGQRIPGTRASTLNSHGNRLVKGAYGWKVPVDSRKIHILAQKLFPFKEEDKHKLGLSGKELKEKIRRNRTMCKLLQKAVDMIKVNLASLDEHEDIVKKYGIAVADLNDSDKQTFYETLPKLLTMNIQAAIDEDNPVIDFNDQIYLAVVDRYQAETGLQLLPSDATSMLRRIDYSKAEVDVLFVDETQDLNRAQQQMALYTVGQHGRLIAVGDRFQSIYAFSGADSSSMDRLETLLSGTSRGCTVEHLSTTFRCPTSVVETAQKVLQKQVWVQIWDCVECPERGIRGNINKCPECGAKQRTPAHSTHAIPVLDPSVHETIEAAPGAPEGEVRTIAESAIFDPTSPDRLTIEKDAMPRVIGGKSHVPTMILCRKNAPLIGAALRLIANQIPATIVGRDISKTLIKYIDEVNPGKKRNKNTDCKKLLSAMNLRLAEIYKKERKLIAAGELDEERVETDSPFALEKDQAAAICIVICGSAAWNPGAMSEEGDSQPPQCDPECELSVRTVKELKQRIDDLFHGGHCPEDYQHPEEKRNYIQDAGDTYCPVCMDKRGIQVEIDRGEHAVRLSSVHKSKGLEALQIYILQPDGLGNTGPRRDGSIPPEEDQRQEVHMEYVAVTRTKFLKGDPNSGILTYLDNVIDTPATAPPSITPPPSSKPPMHPIAAPTSISEPELPQGYSFWKDEDLTIPLLRGEIGAKKLADQQIVYKKKELAISILNSIREGRRPKYKEPVFVYPDPEETSIQDLLDLVDDDDE